MSGCFRPKMDEVDRLWCNWIVLASASAAGRACSGNSNFKADTPIVTRQGDPSIGPFLVDEQRAGPDDVGQHIGGYTGHKHGGSCHLKLHNARHHQASLHEVVSDYGIGRKKPLDQHRPIQRRFRSVQERVQCCFGPGAGRR